ncbi:nicotinate-nucleotide adenylyltransferase [Actinomycetaceae bacterium WB03_NA08]|uniref:Probable nicotinate-nucleotide adenylyltransferase n=1 Tax=Scrofimicrobium canadense TaxID=2652290 RepID=A0A6N7W309_9ACTO|nr:nicotinate-nucleotide adenylyltransferase [Scrofimicrobium canadense]MSS83675.1 nicotinate-nucleotide adenylyltransferase [Scrofimicrobium canadense]
MTRPRIGVMGGTFDPIHHGHLVAASEAMNAFDLEQVLFVPAGVQPFKQDRQVAPAEHRYLMTVIATASNNRFNVSRVDIDREGPSYTYQTLRTLHQEMPETDLFFITGADAMAEILSWKNSEELFELAHFVGVTRPGHDLADQGLPHESVSLLEVPAMAISSTDIRDRARHDKPIWYLVPDGVVQYIGKHGLYQN